MKKIIFGLIGIMATGIVNAQDATTIQLNKPDTNRGLPVMKALSERASAKTFDTTELALQDVSDLLWAANGINRQEEGKRTAPSALNAQDIDMYLFMKQGIYLYQAKGHLLELIVAGDYRNVFSRNNDDPVAASIVLLVSDISRFKFGEDSLRRAWGAMDAGMVSQNISVFCSSVGLITRPRAGMDNQKLKNLLELKETQYLMLNHPVSYKKINTH